MSRCCPKLISCTMNRRKFTNDFIKSVKPPKNKDRAEFTDDNTPSLTLRVGRSKKVFYYRYRDGKLIKRKKIGVFPDISIKDARKQAIILGLRRTKHEPHSQSSLTLSDVYESYKINYLPKLKKSTVDDYQSRFKNHILPVLGHLEISSITPTHISKILKDVCLQTPTTSNRVRAIMSSLFSYAQKSNITKNNPVQSVSPEYKEAARDKIYTKKEMFQIMKAVNAKKEPIKSNLLLIILTGQRVGEINSLKWSDVQFDENNIIIRGKNTKNGLRQVLPITPKILEVLDSIKKYSGNTSEFLFPIPNNSNKHRTSMSAILKSIKKTSEVDEFRLHDIRSKFATVLSKNGVERIVVGKLLNHKQMASDNSVLSIHYDAYDYSVEKRKALEIWNEYIYEEVLRKGYTVEKLGDFFHFVD